MSATENKTFVSKYLKALSGNPKPIQLVNQYIADSDQELKDHIAMFEVAFPLYELIADEMIAEGDAVMVRATFRGIHKAAFAGVAPTGRTVEIPLALIYHIAGGKIVKHWMLADQVALMQQLTVAQHA